MVIRPCILLYAAALLLLLGIPLPRAAAPDLSTVASGPKLPADMRQWVYGEGPEFVGLSSMRLWDRAALRQASTVASHGQMRGFVSKLHAGRPVTVVSLGDSNTQHFGGCFGRGDDAQLAARGVQTVQVRGGGHTCVLRWRGLRGDGWALVSCLGSSVGGKGGRGHCDTQKAADCANDAEWPGRLRWGKHWGGVRRACGCTR